MIENLFYKIQIHYDIFTQLFFPWKPFLAILFTFATHF